MGPLHSDRQYDISASKEGFVLSPVEGTQGDFKAFALAGVTFKVYAAILTCMFYLPVIIRRLGTFYICPAVCSQLLTLSDYGGWT